MGVIDQEVYGALLVAHLPKVIETPAEHERMVAALEELRFAGRELSAEEEAVADLLARLVEEYEERVAPVTAGDPVDTLRFLAGERGLRQADLLDVFGSRSVASAVWNGKRGISKAQAKRLGKRFGVGAELFL